MLLLLVVLTCYISFTRKGTLSVAFECDPDEADELVAATRAELQRLRDGAAAFTPENVSAALEQERGPHRETPPPEAMFCTFQLQ